MQRLEEGLSDTLPMLARDGNFVRRGFSPDLDSARTLRDDTRQVIADLQSRYAETVGIKNLKIRHNNMIGYFIEVATPNAAILGDEKFEANSFTAKPLPIPPASPPLSFHSSNSALPRRPNGRSPLSLKRSMALSKTSGPTREDFKYRRGPCSA